MPTTLTAPQTDLLGAIRQHLAQLDAKYGFTTRLARENGWAKDFTQRVVEEYARFLFIAREGGHPVSPPPIIDKAWHLHLMHTEEYWGDFCPNVLKMQLHHSPETGTQTDAAKLAEWSGMTRATYERYFGQVPWIWLPRRPPRPSPVMKAGLICGVIGIAAIINGAISHSIGLILLGIILIAVGFLLIISARTGIVGGKGSDCGSSCGGADSGGGSSESGHGGHGGGHSCSGGHSCGGHGCGGGCGGGGH